MHNLKALMHFNIIAGVPVRFHYLLFVHLVVGKGEAKHTALVQNDDLWELWISETNSKCIL